jgi:hypothetical protein
VLPNGSWTIGDRYVHDPSTLVREKDEYEEQPERDRRHDEEVGGHDLARVIGEEGPPRLRRRPSQPPHVFGNGRLTHRDPQLLELSVDRGAPQSGFIVDISRINARTSAGTLGRPVRSRTGESRTTPLEHRRWLNDMERCCDSQAHITRSTVVKRSRGRRERFATANWCRSARISKSNAARERTKNRSEWIT